MNISKFQSNLDFIKSLYFNEEWKDEICRDKILAALEEANKKIEKAFGDSMHNLWDHKPAVEAVEKVAKKFPSTLSYEDEKGRIPIQKAAATKFAPKFVPVLAKEGVKNQIGGEDARGGLLMADLEYRDGWNTLQCLSIGGGGDAQMVKVLKELREEGLLIKKDIREQQLLDLSCWDQSKKLFEYFASWDPDALIEARFENEPLIHHHIAYSESEERIIMALKAGFEYHANIGGLLFTKDDEGTTAFDCLCEGQGVEKVMSLLYQILSPARDYPILHHIFINAPQYMTSFMKKFPWAYHLKDHNGRTLHQAVLAAGPDVMNKNDILLATLTDNQIQTKDPVTTLYPFAAMAVGENADLEQCYYLLRRQPSVMDKHSRVGNICRRKKRRKLSK